MKLSAGNEGEEKENGITNETVGDLCVCVYGCAPEKGRALVAVALLYSEIL